MRRRRSASCSSGTETWKGRMRSFSPALAGFARNRLAAPAAAIPIAAVVRSRRRSRLTASGAAVVSMGESPYPTASHVDVCDAFGSNRLAERPERRADLGAEQLRLIPRCEVAALVDLMEVDEVAIGTLYPASWRTPSLAGKDRECSGNGYFPLVGDARVLPIEPPGGGPGVSHPVECDVVKDVVSCDVAERLPVNKEARDLLVAVPVVVKHPGCQADG